LKYNAILQNRYEVLCALAHEVSITNVTSSISTKDLEHPFVIFDCCPPLNKYLHQVIQHGCWEDNYSGKDSAALRV
jgi:hypothetical protein